ncbi:AraC family transcriptional regulator [Mesorhizobium sp. VK9D]|uniref:AraC family transcriptional regulator n=1 Tax=Mesorhizobium australafricanum TaxID=3072311 RepID=UPI002A2425FE|nr:AraC family transcriptional regulator [Mesorhizobium sp. VK9D]MDX8456269.1 AraC family transcriptional regulator [Mesorhizobium sp. VK9D]
MAPREAYGRRLGERFGIEDAPVLVTKTLSKAELAVTHIKGDFWSPVRTSSIPAEDSYLIALQIRGCDHHELWFDGKAFGHAPYQAGATFFYDLTRDPIAEMREPFQSLMFYLPRTALYAFADEMDAPRVDELTCTPGATVDDITIRNLGFSLLTAFDHPDRVGRLFVDHVTLGIGIHIATTYAGIKHVSKPVKGGLPTWQEQRVKELMSANLDGEVPLRMLSNECGLSVGHFSRAFRASTGMAPHQWLLARRIDAAKALLRRGGKSLSEVALACGFADQSHFTRTFTKVTGVSPGAWRREVGGA